MQRLRWVDGEVNATLEQARLYTRVAEQTEAAAEEAGLQAAAADESSRTALEGVSGASRSLQEVQSGADAAEAAMANLSIPMSSMRSGLAEASQVHSVSRQIDDNRRSLGLLGSRLGKLRARLSSIESRLQGGNISEVVDDATKRSLSDVLKDLGRGLYRMLPD